MSKDIKVSPVLNISQHGYQHNFGITDGKYLYWTTEKDVELPVIIRPGDNVPVRTIPEVFH